MHLGSWCSAGGVSRSPSTVLRAPHPLALGHRLYVGHPGEDRLRRQNLLNAQLAAHQRRADCVAKRRPGVLQLDVGVAQLVPQLRRVRALGSQAVRRLKGDGGGLQAADLVVRRRQRRLQLRNRQLRQAFYLLRVLARPRLQRVQEAVARDGRGGGGVRQQALHRRLRGVHLRQQFVVRFHDGLRWI
jgi:hypothetical protein